MKTTHFPPFTRRVFLNRTLQALGALAAMPVAVSMAGAGPAGTEVAGTVGSGVQLPALEFLNAGEYLVLDAVCDTLIPRGGAFELGARDVGLPRRIDHYLTKMDPAVALGFRGALAFVEQQTPELAGESPPFSRLSEDERAAVFNAMLQGGGLPAGVLLALKYVGMSHFYTMDETWKFTGYDGPMLLEETR